MDYSFKGAWWMRNRHVQTILPRFFRPFQKVPVYFEELTTPDGDFLELAWAKNKKPSAPIAIILHGLEGNINSFYAKGMLNALSKKGFNAVLMHFRNCSRAPNKLARAYHSGETSDLSFLIKTLKQRYADSPLYAVGFSLGGNVLAKYLGEQRHTCKLSGAAVISAPYHLSSSCQVIRNSCYGLYQKYLLDRMKKSFSRKLPTIQSVLPLDKVTLNNFDDLWQFDNQITAPLHGFDNAEDYYHQASAQPYLKHIQTPTLLIHAKDDPMLSVQAIPHEAQVSSAVTLAVSERGGHVGFISGMNPFKPFFWLEQAVPHYFTTLANMDKKI
ncbi:hydrolase [Pseudoalteromonas aurantia]|uniref:AB hydrolase-1 domain-containing protein n=1 Tax=Pseudoalteromonas aurantia 208 TaxID=1314867 RepID=A0ABR9E6B1_9GAMM|nr:hydrolase [Pseudoalteromonas aurantia]MBE0366523.1 hypothetical protein [Pseudoalteromonas aurantia 208]